MRKREKKKGFVWFILEDVGIITRPLSSIHHTTQHQSRDPSPALMIEDAMIKAAVLDACSNYRALLNLLKNDDLHMLRAIPYQYT